MAVPRFILRRARRESNIFFLVLSLSPVYKPSFVFSPACARRVAYGQTDRKLGFARLGGNSSFGKTKQSHQRGEAPFERAIGGTSNARERRREKRDPFGWIRDHPSGTNTRHRSVLRLEARVRALPSGTDFLFPRAFVFEREGARGRERRAG